MNNMKDIVMGVSQEWVSLIQKLNSEVLKPEILLLEWGLVAILWWSYDFCWFFNYLPRYVFTK